MQLLAGCSSLLGGRTKQLFHTGCRPEAALCFLWWGPRYRVLTAWQITSSKQASKDCWAESIASKMGVTVVLTCLMQASDFTELQCYSPECGLWSRACDFPISKNVNDFKAYFRLFLWELIELIHINHLEVLLGITTVTTTTIIINNNGT